MIEEEDEEEKKKKKKKKKKKRNTLTHTKKTHSPTHLKNMISFTFSSL